MRNPRRPAALAGLAALLMSGLVAVTHGTAQAAPDPRPQLARHETGADTRAELRKLWTVAPGCPAETPEWGP